jgi:molecular chaperone DnaJ
MKTDPHKILGVPKGASADEIRLAFRRCAMKYHPDRSSDLGDHEKFKECKTAYDTLSAQNENSFQFGSSPDGNSDFGSDWGGFEDLIGQIFRRPRSGPKKGRDASSVVELTLEESCFGSEKTIDVSFQAPCSRCSPLAHDKSCATCFGAGILLIKHRLNICIEPGALDGTMVRIAGAGAPGHPNGDLCLTIKVLPHPVFTRQGLDLHCEMPVLFTKNATGAKVRVQLLRGFVDVDVPPMSANGIILRVRGKGLTDPYGRAGNLYCKVLFAFPQKYSARQLELLLELDKSYDYELSSGASPSPKVTSPSRRPQRRKKAKVSSN